MRQLTKREKIIGFVCAAFCLVLAGRFILTQLIDRQDALAGRITVAAHKISQARAVVAREGAYQQKQKELASRLGIVSSEGTEMARGASRMEEVARQVNVRIINVQPRTVRSEKFYSVYPLQVLLEGEWQGMARFIQVLQASEASLNIDELRLEKASPDAAELKGKLVLSWVRVKP